MKKTLRTVVTTILLAITVSTTTVSAVAADASERNSIECAPSDSGYLETLPGPAISFKEEAGLHIFDYKMSQIIEMAESAGYEPVQMDGTHAAFSHTGEDVGAMVWLDDHRLWMTLQSWGELSPAIICYPVTYRGATIETTHPIFFPELDPILEN